MSFIHRILSQSMMGISFHHDLIEWEHVEHWSLKNLFSFLGLLFNIFDGLAADSGGTGETEEGKWRTSETVARHAGPGHLGWTLALLKHHEANINIGPWVMLKQREANGWFYRGWGCNIMVEVGLRDLHILNQDRGLPIPACVAVGLWRVETSPTW